MIRFLCVVFMLILGTTLTLAQTPAPPKPETKPTDAKPAAKPQPAKDAMPAKDAGPKLPGADELIAKYNEAIGGKAEQNLTSVQSKGTFDLPAFGASGTVESFQKAPNKVVTTIIIPNYGTVSEGYDGTVAWAVDPMNGLRDKTGSELDQVRRTADLHRTQNLKKFYTKMEVTGMQKVAGSDAYVLVLTQSNGGAATWYIDAKSFLLVRSDELVETPQGKLAAEFYYEDYRAVDGARFPFVVKLTNPNLSYIITLSEVKTNTTIDDSKFAKPAQ